MDAAQRQTQSTARGIGASLGRLESRTAEFNTRMSNRLLAPFTAFNNITGSVRRSVNNLITPFTRLGRAVGIGKALNGTKKALGAIGKLIKPVSGGVLGLGVGFVALAVANAKASYEIHKLAKNNGLAYESLNKLTFASNNYGVSAEEMADVLKELRVGIAEFASRGTGKMTDFFKQTGQSAKDWNLKSAEEQLVLFTAELEKMNGSDKALFLDELGDSAFKLKPLIAAGTSELRELIKEASMFGGALGDMGNLEQLNEMFNRIKFTTRNFFTGFVSTIAPAFVSMFDKVLDKFKLKMGKLGGGDLGKGFDLWVRKFSKDMLNVTADMLGSFDGFLNSVSDAFDTIVQLLNKMNRGIFGTRGNAVLTTHGRSQEGAKDFDTAKYVSRELYSVKEEIAKNDLLRKGYRSTQRFKTGKVGTDINPYDAEHNRLLAEARAMVSTTGVDIEALRTTTMVTLMAVRALGGAVGNVMTPNLEHGKLDIDDLIKATEKHVDKKAYELNTSPKVHRKGMLAGTSSALRTAADNINLLPPKPTPTPEPVYARTGVLDSHPAEQLLKDAQGKGTDSLVESQGESKLKAGDVFRRRAEKSALAFNRKMQDLGMLHHEETLTALQIRMEREREDFAIFYEDRLAQLAITHGKESQQYQDLLDSKQQANDLFAHKQLQTEMELQAKKASLRSEEKEAYLLDTFDTLAQGNGIESALNQEAFDASTITEEERATAKAQGLDAERALEDEAGRARIGMTLKVGGAVLDEMAKSSEKAFKIQKAVRIAQATMNTYEMATGAYNSLSSIPYVGPALGAAAAGVAVGFGMMQVKQIKAQQFQGQAHDGIDFVTNNGKSEGSWNLQTGERVVDTKTNKDLKQYLKGSNSNSSKTVGEVHMPITIQGADLSNEELLDRIREMPSEFRNVMSEIM